jgi:predicted metal-dependent hydrolase
LSHLKYFQGYPENIKLQVELLINNGKLKTYLLSKYPAPHEISTDKQLYQYANELKKTFMSNTPPLSKVVYEKQKDLVLNALGTHSFVSRNHGGKLKSKHEIRISNVINIAPKEMLELLVVHELAHFKEKDHNIAFYNLCEYMLSDYHQIEFDLRLFLVLTKQGYTLY